MLRLLSLPAPPLVVRTQLTDVTIVERLRCIPFEALFWTFGLVAIASIDPNGAGGIELCLFEHLGLPCLGDGLGRGIAHLARGNLTASWASHPLAAPVVVVLIYHIATLFRASARFRR